MADKRHQEALKINFNTANFELIKEAISLQ
jgi:hypothetical protein